MMGLQVKKGFENSEGNLIKLTRVLKWILL